MHHACNRTGMNSLVKMHSLDITDNKSQIKNFKKIGYLHQEKLNFISGGLRKKCTHTHKKLGDFKKEPCKATTKLALKVSKCKDLNNIKVKKYKHLCTFSSRK